MAPPGAWGKWLQMGYKKTEPPARGKTGVLSKVKTIWRASTFFSKSLLTRGGPLRVREGGPERVREGGQERVREGVWSDHEKNRWVS